MTREEIMKIENPHEALIEITSSKERSIAEMSEMITEYSTLHNITTGEMAYYPNGEQVLKPKPL